MLQAILVYTLLLSTMPLFCGEPPSFNTCDPAMFKEQLNVQLNAQTLLSIRLVNRTYLCNDQMPQHLHTKIFKKKLHKRCIFLTSVHEKDYESVQWILSHDQGYLKGKPEGYPYSQGYRLFSNRFCYYSLCSSEKLDSSFITPLMIAEHNKDEKMLTILQPLTETIKKERYEET